MGGRQEAHSREGFQDQQKEVGLDANVWCLVQETYTQTHVHNGRVGQTVNKKCTDRTSCGSQEAGRDLPST